MLYKNKNSLTGEFIQTDIPNLDIPENIERPKIGNVERTMHIELTRAVGWHYHKNDMLFIPAYSESNGVKTSFEISIVSTRGFVVRFKSQLFVKTIPLGLFLKICFPQVTRDLVLSLTHIDSKYMSSKYLNIPNSNLYNHMKSIINPKINLDYETAIERFKYLFTKQTFISNNKRLKKILSLSYFIGCYLKRDVEVYDGMIYRTTPLTDRDIFRLEHSGILDIDLVSVNGEVFSVVLLNSLSVNLNSISRSLTDIEIKYVEDCESNSNNVYIDDKNLGSVDIPQYNTLPIYCIMINRLVIFNLLDITINMNSYENQTLSTLNDLIDVFNKTDRGIIDDKILSSNMLTGVSAVRFDTERIKRYISKENSSLIVLTNNENPVSLLFSSGYSKVTKPVSHLSRDAIKIQEGTFGILDGTDVSENPNIGKSIPLVVTSFISNQKIYTYLYIVKDRCITDKVIEVESVDLGKYIICEYNANLEEEYVLAKISGVTEYVKSENITHARVSPFSSTSICRSFALYLNMSDLKRSQMSGKAIEQARTILLPERALVETGIESVALTLNSNLRFQVTVRQVIEEYIEREHLMNVSDLDKYTYQLDVIEQSSVQNMYKISARENSNVFGIFILENKKTLKGSCTFNKLLPPLTDYYNCDDYIYCDHNIHKSLLPIENSSALKFHTKDNKDFHRYGIGCGINAKVMFGFYHSMTVDDASVISDRFVRNMSMDTPIIFNITYTIKKPLDDVEEKYGFKNGNIKEGFDTYGLPKIGKMVYPNETLIYKYTINHLTNDIIETNYIMPYNKCGEVFKIQESKTDIIISFYNVVRLEIGDKSGGRHGNKFTIAKILPMEQMFYDKETGEPIDLILNPLSTCSRMNLGQLPELYISAKQVSENKGIKIEPLFEPIFEKYIKENLETQDINMRTLIDGETGLELPNKMFVGYMYILRSVHITEDKIRAIGDSNELDPAFLQPVGLGDKNQRGQSVDAMVIDLLTSLGCYDLIDEIKGIMSSDVSTYQKVISEIEEKGYNPELVEVGNNNQINHLKMATLCLYVYLEQDNNMFGVKYANDEIVMKYKELNLQNIKQDLIDNKMCKDISFFSFNCKLFTPIAIEKMNCLVSITVLKEINSKFLMSNLTSDLCIDIINELSYVQYKYYEGLGKYMFFVSKSKTQDYSTGMKSLIEIAEYYSEHFDEVIDILQKRKNISLNVNSKFNVEIEDLINLARQVEKSGKYTQFISSTLPVMPLKYRLSSIDSSILHDLTRGYLHLASLCNLSTDSNNHLRMLYDSLNKLLLGTNSEYKSIFEFLFKKELDGRIRGLFMKTKVKHSMRANISPADYGSPDFVGVPLVCVIFLFQPQINHMVNKSFKWVKEYAKTHIEVSEYLASLYYLPINKIIEVTGGNIQNRFDLNFLTHSIKNVCNNELCYYYRPPALHETSVRGGFINVVEDRVMRINTLITSDQNADFDGDQQPLNVVYSYKAIKDVITHLIPSSKICRSNDGVSSLTINQDSLLGLYHLTLPSEDKDDVKVFSSVRQIYNHIEVYSIKPNQEVLLINKERVVRGTAGRIIVSSLVDNLSTLTDKGEPLINKIINSTIDNEDKKSISSILMFIVKHNDGENSSNIISKLQELGYRINHLINITLSFNDFKPILEIENPKDKFMNKFIELKSLDEYGLLPNNWINDLENEFLQYKKSIGILNLLGKDNSLFKMVDSGAKGKESQLEKMFSLIGFAKGNNGTLPTPLFSSFVRGMSQFQTEDLSYEQRENAISTVHDTSNPGVALRTGCMELGGLIVRNKTKDFNPVYPHRIFYTSNVDVDKYKVIYGNEVVDVPIKCMKFKGQYIDNNLLKQLSKNPDGRILTEEGYIIQFKKDTDPLFDEIVNTKIPSNIIDKVKMSIENNESHCIMQTFINYMGEGTGIPQDYTFVNSIGLNHIPVGTTLGLKSSTSTSEPATQMVISKRNLVANEEAYSGLEIFQNALQYGKIFGNNKNLITMLSPEDGTIHISIQPNCTLVTLNSSSDKRYTLYISIMEEENRNLLVKDGDFVFATQAIVGVKNSIPENRIHPTLSLTWDTVEIDGIIYENILPNPDDYIIQFSRFIYFKFLTNLYRENNINLDIIHYSSYALQQLRIVETIRRDDSDINNYVEIGKYLKLKDKCIFNFKLLNGKESIFSTSGLLSAYIYQDPMSAIYKSFKNGKISEVGYIGHLVLGLHLGDEIKGNELVYEQGSITQINNTSLYKSVEEINTFIPVDNDDIVDDNINIDLDAFFADLNVKTHNHEETSKENKDDVNLTESKTF